MGIDTADVDVVRRGLRVLSLPLDRGMGLQVRGDGIGGIVFIFIGSKRIVPAPSPCGGFGPHGID